MNVDRLFAPVTGEDLVDRTEIVERLLRNFKNMDRPNAQQYALIGSRRIGKTSICREVYNRMLAQPWENMPIPIWIDIGEVVKQAKGDDDRFADLYLATFARGYIQHELPNAELPHWEEFSLSQIRDFAIQMGDSTLQRRVEALMRTKDPVVNRAAVAMSTVARIVKEGGKRFAFIIDEIQDLERLPYGMNLLYNYRIAFESIFCLHIFTGSAARIMTCDVFGYTSPLHGRVTEVLLDPFTPSDDFALIDKLGREYGQTWDIEAKIALNQLTGGYPFYTTCVLTRLSDEGTGVVHKVEAQEAFQRELMRGRIHLEFMDRTDPQLKSTGNATLAVKMLKLIVDREKETTHMLELQKIDGYDEEVLEKLARADIIRLNGTMVRMLDPPYKMWLRDFYLPLVWFESDLATAESNLRRTMGRLVNDLGRMFESKVWSYLWFFKNKTVDGKFFGYSEQQIQLPDFYSVVRRLVYRPEYSYVAEPFEVDVHGMYRLNHELNYWFVECKYLDTQPALTVLEGMLRKRDLFVAGYPFGKVTLWFCTKLPLSDRLRDFAQEHGILFSSETDLEELFAALT